MVSNIFATSSIWAAHFSPHRDDPAAWDPVSKTGGMTVRLCPSLRAPPPGERARALTTPQREHHAQQAGTRTQRHALVTACQPGGAPSRAGAPPDNGAVAQTGERCARIAEAAGSNPASSTRASAWCHEGESKLCRLSGSLWFDSTTAPAAWGGPAGVPTFALVPILAVRCSGSRRLWAARSNRQSAAMAWRRFPVQIRGDPPSGMAATVAVAPCKR